MCFKQQKQGIRFNIKANLNISRPDSSSYLELASRAVSEM